MQTEPMSTARRIAIRAVNTSQGPFLNRPALTGSAAVCQMADDLRIFTANAGAVTENDLEVLGWTRAQVQAYGAAARERATREASNRRIAR
jgi:hypothetical protein